MIQKTLQKHARAVITSSFALVVLAGGLAWAAGVIPGEDGVIHGCYNNNSGTLRLIIPTESSCNNNESAIFWNQTGPQGLAGADGDDGSDGSDGSNGSDGASGVSGYETVSAVFTAPPQGDPAMGSVPCPSGKTVLGGGAYHDWAFIYMAASHPYSDNSGWFVKMQNTTDFAREFTVTAICANVN